MDKDGKEPVDHATAPSPANLDKEVNTSDFSDRETTSDRGTKVPEAVKTEHEYITGVKLWLAMASITLVCFLMLLDMSIIVTVSLDTSSMTWIH
jgi:hypothetical protein